MKKYSIAIIITLVLTVCIGFSICASASDIDESNIINVTNHKVFMIDKAVKNIGQQKDSYAPFYLCEQYKGDSYTFYVKDSKIVGIVTNSDFFTDKERIAEEVCCLNARKLFSQLFENETLHNIEIRCCNENGLWEVRIIDKLDNRYTGSSALIFYDYFGNLLAMTATYAKNVESKRISENDAIRIVKQYIIDQKISEETIKSSKIISYENIIDGIVYWDIVIDDRLYEVDEITGTIARIICAQ